LCKFQDIYCANIREFIVQNKVFSEGAGRGKGFFITLVTLVPLVSGFWFLVPGFPPTLKLRRASWLLVFSCWFLVAGSEFPTYAKASAGELVTGF
jgi:hypothetical protein